MFSNGLIAFMFSVGFAAWVYSKIIRSTGGNTSGSLIVAGFSGLLAFISLMTLLSFAFQ